MRPRYILATDLYDFLADLIAKATVEGRHSRHGQGAIMGWQAVIDHYKLTAGAKVTIIRDE